MANTAGGRVEARTQLFPMLSFSFFLRLILEPGMPFPTQQQAGPCQNSPRERVPCIFCVYGVYGFSQ